MENARFQVTVLYESLYELHYEGKLFPSRTREFSRIIASSFL